MSYQSINPATGEVLQEFEEHTDDQMMKALAAADATYRESWSSAPNAGRTEVQSIDSTTGMSVNAR